MKHLPLTDRDCRRWSLAALLALCVCFCHVTQLFAFERAFTARDHRYNKTLCDVRYTINGVDIENAVYYVRDSKDGSKSYYLMIDKSWIGKEFTVEAFFGAMADWGEGVEISAERGIKAVSYEHNGKSRNRNLESTDSRGEYHFDMEADNCTYMKTTFVIPDFTTAESQKIREGEYGSHLFILRVQPTGRPTGGANFGYGDWFFFYMAGDTNASFYKEANHNAAASFLHDLITWLTGKGDPLGLGEHTTALESVVVNVISLVSAILLSGGIVNVVGVVGGSVPPPMPDMPDLDGLEPKRQEEEEEKPAPDNGGTPPPPPTEPEVPDPNKFNPSDYSYGDHLTQQPDGDVVMRSPATGKDVHFYSQGDGTWISDSGLTYTADDIANRLSYEAEHSDYVRDVADTAAFNQKKFHEDWDKTKSTVNKDLQDFNDWLHEQEKQQQRKDEQLKRLAEKYNLAPSEKAVRDAIKFQKLMDEFDAKIHSEEVKAWGESVEYVETVDKACDTTLFVMGKWVPGGKQVYDGYYMIKSVGVAQMEASVRGENLGGHALAYGKGLAKGLIGVAQYHASDVSKGIGMGVGTEYVIFAGGEGITGGMDAFANSKGETFSEVTKDVMKGAANGFAKKTGAFVVSKTFGVVSPQVGATVSKSTGTLGGYNWMAPFNGDQPVDPLGGPVGAGGCQDRIDDIIETIKTMNGNIKAPRII